MDLSQDRPNAARVVRVSPENLNSGDAINNKKLKLNYLFAPDHPFEDLHRKIVALYRSITAFDVKISNNMMQRAHQLSQWNDRIIEAIGGAAGSRATNLQLDLLGKLYETDPQLFISPDGRWNDRICKHNEILVASHTDHIAAIVVPSYRDPGNILPPHLYGARVRLQAALVGLSHLSPQAALPNPLPVVIYDVNNPTGQKYSFVGQTARELKTAALEALATLGEDGIAELRAQSSRGNCKNAEGYRSMTALVRLHLGLDINRTPSTNQDSWSEIATSKLAALRASPARLPQSGQTSPGSDGRY